VKENHPTPLLDQVRRQHPGLDVEQAIVLICEQLLSDAEAEPPVAVERIASLRGIAEIERREQPWAGVLEPRGRGLVVGVRRTDGYERQRFTICHEAGHTLFPGFSEKPRYRCNDERTPLERLCDFTATELLLPRRYFREDLRQGSFDFDSVERLADSYEASIEATTLRVAKLWPEPALALVLSERHKPAERDREAECEPKLRLDYGFGNGDWAYLLKHKSVGPDSPLSRALAGELVDEVSTLDELSSEDLGPVEIHARRYGAQGRVLALIRKVQRTNERRSDGGL
jgi:hypothetical protein